MSPFRILIVDDQKDIRRVLQAGIETLGEDYQVYAMPSAEEALLDASRTPVDLLITDFRLPGMSGSELVSKMKRYCPDMKVFIITGMTDPYVHRQVKEAKPDDFFIKPVPLGDFLTAVIQTLNKTEKKTGSDPKGHPDWKERHHYQVKDILAEIRKELGAEAVVLADHQGKSLAGDGKLPANLLRSLPAGLTGLAETTGVLEQVLETLAEGCLLFFKGKSRGLYAIPAGSSRVLILTVNSNTTPFNDQAIQSIFRALKEINALESQGNKAIPTSSPDREIPAIPEKPVQDAPRSPTAVKTSEPMAQAVTELTPDELKRVAEHFEQAARQRLAPDEVEEFWKAAMEDDEARSAKRPNDINYDEARRLGLAPEEDNRKENG